MPPVLKQSTLRFDTFLGLSFFMSIDVVACTGDFCGVRDLGMSVTSVMTPPGTPPLLFVYTVYPNGVRGSEGGLI